MPVGTMTIGTMTTKGQITIPKEVRDGLHLRPGDKIEFQINKDGTAVLRPRSVRVEDVCGMLSRYAKGKKVSVEDMHDKLGAAFARNKP